MTAQTTIEENTFADGIALAFTVSCSENDLETLLFRNNRFSNLTYGSLGIASFKKCRGPFNVILEGN